MMMITSYGEEEEDDDDDGYCKLFIPIALNRIIYY